MRLPRNFFARCSLRLRKSRPDHRLHRLPPSAAPSSPLTTFFYKHVLSTNYIYI
jgi:hypothetical protein